MTIEVLKDRISKKEVAIDKLEKKVAKLAKAKDDKNSYWDEYDYRYAVKDLATAKDALEKYKADLQMAEDKAASRNIQPILDCLQQWKERYINYCELLMDSYLADYKNCQEAEKIIENKFNISYVGSNRIKKLMVENPNDEDLQKYSDSYNALNDSKYRVINSYLWEDKWVDRLAKDLDIEAERKYDDIIERTNYYVGKITDASNLKCGMDGSLNGIIVGEKGKVEVFTIIAGGPVQRDHFRVLVKARQ